MRTDEKMHARLRYNGGMWQNEGWFDGFKPEQIGVSFSGGERDHLFMNLHGDQFVDLYGLSGADSPSDGRGFAILDFDRDGRPDMAVVSSNSPTLNLYHNQLAKLGGDNRFVAVRLVGGQKSARPSTKWSNRNGFGAQVTVRAGEHSYLREHRCGEGFAAQNSQTMIVGVGGSDSVAEIEVRWPSGKTQSVSNIAAGELVTFHEDPADLGGSPVSRQPYAVNAPAPVLTETAPAPRPAAGMDRLMLGGESADAPFRMYVSMATWCPSCKRHLPQLRELRDAMQGERLEVVGVPIDPNDSPDMLDDYVDEYAPAYRLLTQLDDAGRAQFDGVVKKEIKTDALPVSVVTRADGTVLRVIPGIPSVSELRQLFQVN